MSALLPRIGGVLLGRYLPRWYAVAAQIVLWALAAVVLTATALDHGGAYTDGYPIVPALAVVSALALAAGMCLRRRAVARPQG